MKTIILLITGFLNPLLMSPNNDVYEQKMLQAIEQLNHSITIEQYQTVANIFERISTVEENQWQPMYYAAYSYIMMSFQITEGSKRDEILDQAQKWIDKSFVLAPDESELFVLQAFLYPSRVIVNPIERGMKLMDLANKALLKAKQLNEDNPRAYYLEAVMVQNSPEAMGGGAEKAFPIYKMALEKFEIFVPNTIIDPDWGEEAAKEAFQSCHNNVEE